MSIIGVVLVGSLLVFRAGRDECKKVRNPKPVNTWMTVTLAETHTVKTLRGQIVDTNEKAISGALIEIIRISENDEGKVIYVCRTPSGGFRFDKLKDGHYLLRVSADGHDLTSVRVRISKSSDSSKEVLIPVRVSS